MSYIQPCWPQVIIEEFDGLQMCKNIERFGRTCYKSEGRITADSYVPFLKSIIERGHESVLEHEKITVQFVCSRSVSHELIRHRIASYSQVSQRYVNYSKEAFQGKIPVIVPFYLITDKWGPLKYKTERFNIWYEACSKAAEAYFKLLELGCRPEEARAVLPNSTATEIVVTANIREWRHILRLRTAPQAFVEMKQVMLPLFCYLQENVPVLFDDIGLSVLDGVDRENWAHLFIRHQDEQLEVINQYVEAED